MPDTFASWFTVIELHLWMISARLMKEETIGFHARDMLTEAFFKDVVHRSSLLGVSIYLMMLFSECSGAIFISLCFDCYSLAHLYIGKSKSRR